MAVRGWVNYYGTHYKSALYPTLGHIDRKLVEWATRKFKRLRGHGFRSRRGRGVAMPGAPLPEGGPGRRGGCSR